LAEVMDLQELAPKIWAVPEPPLGLHNWVVFQSLVASLSASGRWPQFTGQALGKMVDRVFCLTRGMAKKKKGLPSRPPRRAD
ncbi:MAG: hypothetical protein ACKPKO_11170, partial [Candidatus Fonsibacter sp.]